MLCCSLLCCSSQQPHPRSGLWFGREASAPPRQVQQILQADLTGSLLELPMPVQQVQEALQPVLVPLGGIPGVT
jgi:hypothetical protein